MSDRRSKRWGSIALQAARRSAKAGCHYDAKPCFTAHHAFVSFRGALEWKNLSHGPQTSERAESEGILRINGAAGRPARDRASRGNQQPSLYLERLIRIANQDEFAVDTETAQDRVHRLSARDGR